MIEERKTSLHPISEILCETYKILLRKGEVSFTLHDSHIYRIDSIVKTVNASYFGFPRFNGLEEKAAAYFCLIIKGHPVTDGNKRLAVLWLEIFTESMNIPIRLPSHITLDVLAVAVEQAKFDHHRLIEIIKDLLFGKGERK